MIQKYAQTSLRNYAPKGALITIVSQSLDGVCIAEYNGLRFPCRIEQLGDEMPIDEVKHNDNLQLF